MGFVGIRSSMSSALLGALIAYGTGKLHREDFVNAQNCHGLSARPEHVMVRSWFFMETEWQLGKSLGEGLE